VLSDGNVNSAQIALGENCVGSRAIRERHLARGKRELDAMIEPLIANRSLEKLFAIAPLVRSPTRHASNLRSHPDVVSPMSLEDTSPVPLATPMCLICTLLKVARVVVRREN
jgi:hypothetical protein